MNPLDAIKGVISDPSDLLSWLVDFSAKGLLIMAVAAVVVFILRKSSSCARHLIWTLALVSLLLLPVLSPMLPLWKLPVLPALTPTQILHSSSSDSCPER